jgi:hypothetical protein
LWGLSVGVGCCSLGKDLDAITHCIEECIEIKLLTYGEKENHSWGILQTEPWSSSATIVRKKQGFGTKANKQFIP